MVEYGQALSGIMAVEPLPDGSSSCRRPQCGSRGALQPHPQTPEPFRLVNELRTVRIPLEVLHASSHTLDWKRAFCFNVEAKKGYMSSELQRPLQLVSFLAACAYEHQSQSSPAL